MKWWLWFAVIQLVNIPLMAMGWLICLSPAFAGKLWLWWNDDDGTGPKEGWWDEYVWLAWRNPVANLRHVPGVSGPGRPLLYHWWIKPGLIIDPKEGHYIKIGWESGPPYYPVFSLGSGRGY